MTIAHEFQVRTDSVHGSFLGMVSVGNRGPEAPVVHGAGEWLTAEVNGER